MVLAPGLLMDAGRWIDWWALDDTGAIGPAVFDFDEDSLDFYDYTCADWYLAPRDGTQRSLVGPYVDFNGLNDYIVTATIPVTVGGRFVGVAGADLSVDELERRLNIANRRVRAELVVLNASGRIVASTSVRHVAGSLLRTTSSARTRLLAMLRRRSSSSTDRSAPATPTNRPPTVTGIVAVTM